jgi:TonB C terminal
VEPVPRPVRRPRWPAALAASVALHLGLGAALLLHRPDPSPARPAPIAVTMVELRPMAPAAPHPVPDVGGSTTSAPPPGIRERPAPLPSDGPPGGPDVHLATPQLPPADPDLPDLDWAVPPSTSGTASGPDLSARPSPEAIALVAPGDPSPEARLQRLFREDLGRQKVQSGLADPSFNDLGKALVAAWTPETVVNDRGFSGYLKHLGQGLAEYAGTWLRQAGQYGRTGSPFAPGEIPPGLGSLAAVPESLATQISDQMAVARAMAEQSRVSHAALVRIVQRADGRLVSVELLRPSNDSSVDAQALRDLRAVAATLPPPGPGALAGRATVASTWEFTLVVSITPPIPMIFIRLDEVLGLLDARVPLDRRLFKLVRLVSVE